MDDKKEPDTRFRDVETLDKDQAHRQIEALREGIEYHDYWYYVKNAPKISDATYDKLLRRLQNLEETFPEFATDDSPTRRVGAKPMDRLEKVKHSAAMLSLNAVYEANEVEAFDDLVRREAQSRRVEYVVEPKFDGLSLEVVYEKGAFSRGATRGDGQTGEDVSKNAKTIRAIPLHLHDSRRRAPDFLAVRGEVFMRKHAFQELNKQRVENGEEPFANPRNAAAGTVRQLDPRKVAAIPLDIFFYDILEIRGQSFESHWDVLQSLPAWGLRTNPQNKKCSGLAQVKRYHSQLADRREDLDYEVDGVVIKLNDYGLRKRLGTRQRSPRWALAWKFAPKQEVTTLHEIVVQVGRTGMLTPVGLLEPVDVGGVTVSRATLHNEDEVRRKDVREGDEVRIERAGDVIPEVVERVPRRGEKRGRAFSMPGKCPACGSRVDKEGAYYFCPASLSCRGQLAGRVIHYASREAMDIAGLGNETAKELVEKKMVTTIADLYRLSVEDLRRLEGFADKSAKQLHEAIHNANDVRLDRFLYALGIRHVGKHVAEVLARHFQEMKRIQKAALKDLQSIREIGPEIARSVHSFFRQDENRRVLQQLSEAGVAVRAIAAHRGGEPLDGVTFVFTGELADYTRDEAQRLVEDLGGRATSSVSGNTDYVIAGDSPGRKLQEAKTRHIEVINEDEFTEMVRT